MSLPTLPDPAVPDAAILQSATQAGAAGGLRLLVAAGWDRAPLLPLPAGGTTLARWRVLAAVGGADLVLAKLFEGHTDALAILAEAGLPTLAPPASLWGTWCAEPPAARLRLEARGDGHVLVGRKAWCSGARDLSHAIVSCWDQDGRARLAAVALAQPGVAFDGEDWQAVGMRDSASIDVLFDGVAASAVGGPGFYVQRAGFWHGGAGVAACWYGAAASLAAQLAAQLTSNAARDPHRLAQLGEVAVALQGSAALLRASAAAFDLAPSADAMQAALSLRLSVEASAAITLTAVGRALGAGPLCKDAALARLFADLPVFLRQSHAERDQAALAASLLDSGATPWTL